MPVKHRHTLAEQQLVVQNLCASGEFDVGPGVTWADLMNGVVVVPKQSVSPKDDVTPVHMMVLKSAVSLSGMNNLCVGPGGRVSLWLAAENSRRVKGER